MAKWSHLEGKYDEAPKGDDKYNTRLLEATGRIYESTKAANIEHLAEAIALEVERKETLEAKLESTTFDLEVLRRVFIKRMKDAGLTSAVVGGYRYTPSPEPHPNVTDREALREWAREHMPDNMILPPQTLKAQLKERLEAGEALPDGVDVHIQTTLKRSKA